VVRKPSCVHGLEGIAGASIPAVVSLKWNVVKVKNDRQEAQENLRRIIRIYIDVLFLEEKYNL
jgi:hypothetical protein